jgi:hypothetical protein
MSARGLDASDDNDWHGQFQHDPDGRPGARSQRGLQFEEGIGWDTDVPNEFMIGMDQGRGLHRDETTADPRPNHNLNVFEKPYDQTMRERAHVGSASWVEAPSHLDAFVAGVHDEKQEVGYVDDQPYAHEQRDGGHYGRPSPARIVD